MKTLIFQTPTKFKILNSQIPISILRFHFPSRENPRFRHFSSRKCFQIHGNLNVSPAKVLFSAESSNYGGWDDYELGSWSANSGESAQLRKFLGSIGIDDKKLVFMFLLGLVSAFAISRIRVSTIMIFPAAFLVFGAGFSFGFVKGGSFNELSLNKRRLKEDLSRFYSEKLRILVDFLDGFDDKLNNLKDNIQRAIDSNRITIGDLENYASLVESMRASASSARNVVEASMNNVGNSYIDNQKPSGRKKGTGEVGFELSHFLGSLFGEKPVASKANKVKDDGKSESVDTGLINQTRGDVSLPVLFSSPNNSKGVLNQGFAQDTFNKPALNQDRDRRIDISSENGNIRSDFLGGRSKRFVESEAYDYESNRLQFVNTHDTRDVSFNTSQGSESKRWKSDNNLLDSVDFSVRWKHTKTEASFIHEQLQKSSRSYRSSYNLEKSENEEFGKRECHEDDSHLTDHLSAHENDVISSSSKFADDVVFDKYLTEASGILKEAKELMRGRHDEERVEVILHRSATLLSQAIEMKPMSLLAVGQLGNTYLLHGELKLHVSRELRTLLARNDPIFRERPQDGLGDQFSSRDKILSLLISACEECEELLVRAGRKYRLALSIDGDDVRSLYNWGLALSFRAQLIADIGPEAAFDADKLFLAAIDKFDTMMTRGNIHAPDALFRWGAILQQRSRLRPSNSKEKVKLLQQAKRLYEDALHMDSKSVQVRDALSSCISELNYRYF